MLMIKQMHKEELIRKMSGYFSEYSLIPKEARFLREMNNRAVDVIQSGGRWTEEMRLEAIREMNQRGHHLKVLNLTTFNQSVDKEMREGMLIDCRSDNYWNRVTHFRLLLEVLEESETKLSKYENPFYNIRRFVITPIAG